MDYRLLLGDSVALRDDVGRVDAVITDPPYGINMDTNYTRFRGDFPSRNHRAIAGDDAEFDPSPWLDYAPVVILFGGNHFAHRLPPGAWIVWDKRYNGRTGLRSDAEVIWCNHGHGVWIYAHHWDGFIRASEIGERTIHPTQKPVALFRWLIERYTKPGDLVFDPYMGSGACGIAAMQTGRRFVGVEIDAGHYDAAWRRIESYMTQEAACDTI